MADNEELRGKSEEPGGAGAVYRFGVFELDGATLELRRSGRRVHLAPQPARLLRALLARAGELVSREELARELWGEGTFVESEAGLHTAVRQVRNALGDSSRGARFVETLPRRGYRFVGELRGPATRHSPASRTSTSPQGEPSGAAVRPSPASGRRSWLGIGLAACLAAGVAGGAALLVWQLAAGRAARPPAGEQVDSSSGLAASAPSPPALDSLFKARFILAQGGADRGRRAAALYRQALALDPGNALARAGLAESLLADLGRPDTVATDLLGAALTEAQSAVDRDPTLAEAWSARARARWLLRWDWAGAGADHRRAVELAPDDAGLAIRRAYFLSASGDHSAALAEAHRARRLDPLSPATNLDLAWLYLYARRYEEAVAEGLRALELSPGFFGAHHCLAETYALLGRDAESLIHLEGMTAAAGAAPEVLADLDDEDRRDAVAAWWRRENGGAIGFPLYDRALLVLDRGRRDEALETLESSFDRREAQVAFLGVDPRWDPMRRDEGFGRLLEKIGRGSRGEGSS